MELASQLVSTQLILELYATSSNARVNFDLTGPSISRIFGVDDQSVQRSSSGWVPMYADETAARLTCMSVRFLLKNKNDSESVVWRGPRKNGVIRQFLKNMDRNKKENGSQPMAKGRLGNSLIE